MKVSCVHLLCYVMGWKFSASRDHVENQDSECFAFMSNSCKFVI